MSVSLSLHGIDRAAEPRLREIFNAHARRLHRRLEGMPDLVRLVGRIETDPARKTCGVTLRLELPGGLLVAADEGPDLKVVLAAFEELERRLDRHLARSRNSSCERRADARPLPAADARRTSQPVPGMLRTAARAAASTALPGASRPSRNASDSRP
jgi:ribosome-associated translation inhibitor RaiA